MSQGYIGYHLQNAIGNELGRARPRRRTVATVVTQALRRRERLPPSGRPTKPVGAFYDKATAERIAAEKGYTMVEDAGRGYRQVVPSPKPDGRHREGRRPRPDSTAAASSSPSGGGGIPVVRRDGKLVRRARRHRQGLCLGASWRRARSHADALVILTAVEPRLPSTGARRTRRGLAETTRRRTRHAPTVEAGAVRPRLHAAEGQGCRFVRQDRRAGHHRLARTGRSRRPRRGRYGRPSLILPVPFPGSKGPAA